MGFLALDLSDQITIRDFTPGDDDSESSSFLGCSGSSAPQLTCYSAPVISGSVFYAGTYIGEVWALDAFTGARKWEPYESGKNIVGGVAVAGNALVFAAGDELYRLDTRTGRLAWDEPFDTGGKIWCTPVISGSTVYFANLHHKVYAVNLQSGLMEWEQGFNEAIASTPLIVDDTLFVGTFGKKFYALDISQQGAPVWDEPFKAEDWFWTRPAYHDGTIYVGTLGGKFYAIDAITGQPRWDQPYDTGTGDRIRSAPVIVGDVVIFGSQDDSVYGLKLKDGREAWAPQRFEDDIMADPYVSGSVVYFLDKDDEVHAINAELGNEIWHKKLEID